MKHEELIKQYDEDCKNHERPWRLWQYKCKSSKTWQDFFHKHPNWLQKYEYRRKESPFTPEYFSGLNWRDAEPYIMRKVDASMYGEEWRSNVLLLGLNKDPYIHNKFKTEYGNFQYICTTPQAQTQTHAHPTINTGDVKLPRPEIKTPKTGTIYWRWIPKGVFRDSWKNCPIEQEWLTAGKIHLVKDRAQAWADWWENTVINQLKGE